MTQQIFLGEFPRTASVGCFCSLCSEYKAALKIGFYSQEVLMLEHLLILDLDKNSQSYISAKIFSAQLKISVGKASLNILLYFGLLVQRQTTH